MIKSLGWCCNGSGYCYVSFELGVKMWMKIEASNLGIDIMLPIGTLSFVLEL